MSELFREYMNMPFEDSIQLGDESLPITFCDDKDCFLPLIIMHILHLQYNFGEKVERKNPCVAATFVATGASDSLLNFKVIEYKVLNKSKFKHYLKAAAESIRFLLTEALAVSDPIKTVIGEVGSYVNKTYQIDEAITTTCLIKGLFQVLELHEQDYSEFNKSYVLPLLKIGAKKTLMNEKQLPVTNEFSPCDDEPTIETDDVIQLYLEKSNKLVQHSDEIVSNFLKQLAIITVAKSMVTNKLKKFSSGLSKSDLVTVDEEIILAALLGNKDLLNSLATAFKQPTHLVVFSLPVYQLREDIFNVFESRTFEATSDGNKSWFEYAERYTSYLTFNTRVKEFFKTILDKREDRVSINIKLVANAIKASSSDIFKRFCSVNTTTEHNKSKLDTLLKIKQVKLQVFNEVIGQDNAVTTAISALRSSVITTTTSVKGLFTFFGGSGTGKTLLATTLASQFNDVFDCGFQTNIFNMENYADKRDVGRMFGSGQQYVDSLLGQLTSSVEISPRQFIVFDEIEKANPRLIQSLLTLIDTGKAKDYTSDREVDFSQCYLIFTSNLGQEAIEKFDSDKLTLNPFDLLKSDKRGLSTEFVNRLSKGYSTIFQSLSAKSLLKITSKSLLHYKLSKDNLIKWSVCGEHSIINTMSYEVSPRSINSQISKLNSEIMAKIEPTLHSLSSDQFANIVLKQEDEVNHENKMIMYTDLNVADKKIHLKTSHIDFFSGSYKSFMNKVESGNYNAILLDENYIEKVVGEPFAKVCDAIYASKSISENILIVGIVLVPKNKAGGLKNNIANINSELYFDTKCLEHQHLDYQFEIKEKNVKFLERIIDDVNQLCGSLKGISLVRKKPFVSNYDIQISVMKKGLKVQICNMVKSPSFYAKDLSLPFLNYADIPSITTADVIGLNEVKNKLVKVVKWLKNDDYLSQHDVDIPKGYLLAGEPGTGKTFLAKAIAGECGIPFFNVNAADLTIGDVDKNIKDLFNVLSKYQPSILFIDELDSIAMTRGQAPLQSNRTVNSLLTAIDGFNSTAKKLFVIAATNFPDQIDPALKRSGRLEETLVCELPNKLERTETIKRLVKKHSIVMSLNETHELVSISKGASVAFIEKLFRESFYQKQYDVKWQFSDIKEAFVSFTLGNENSAYQVTEAQIVKTAYHEVGHLICQRILFPDEEVRLITIQPRRNSLGSVSITPDEHQSNLSRKELKNRLQVLLAGRAAEILMLGDEVADVGAISDIHKATVLAKRAIELGGLSKSLGLVDYSIFKCSEPTVLLEVQKWIEQALIDVSILLKNNKNLLIDITKILILEESLDKLAIDELFLSFNKKNNTQKA